MVRGRLESQHTLTHVLHANWSAGSLCLWAESSELFSSHAAKRLGVASVATPTQGSNQGEADDSGTSGDASSKPRTLTHPFALPHIHLDGILKLEPHELAGITTGSLRLRLPAVDSGNGVITPLPSSTLARALGAATLIQGADEPELNPLIEAGLAPDAAASQVEEPAALPVSKPVINVFDVPVITLHPLTAASVVMRLADILAEREELGSSNLSSGDDLSDPLLDNDAIEPSQPLESTPVSDDVPSHHPGSDGFRWVAGGSLDYFAQTTRLARYLLVQQRFVPSLVQATSGEIKGSWLGWMSDEATSQRISALVQSCPASARCVADHFRHDGAAVTQDYVHAVIDAQCRASLMAESFADALTERDPMLDPHVAWLGGLLQDATAVKAGSAARQEMIKRIRGWIGVLEERGASSSWRLMLRLAEPDPLKYSGNQTPDLNDAAWSVSFHLQSVEQPSLVIDASEVWMITGDSATIMGRRIDLPHELMLGELGRASRFYRRLEDALEQTDPVKIDLTTKQAYEFLREVRPVLTEQGVGVQAPDWWDSPAARVGAKLRLETEEENPFSTTRAGLTNAAKAQLGLSTLVGYQWEIAVGDTTLSLHEFEQLAAKRTPLVRVNGRWVEIRPEDVAAAVKFIREHPGGQVKLAEALKMAYGSDLKDTGIQIVGMEATGWLNAFLNSESSSKQLAVIPTPTTFKGTLRPYQSRGVSWMAFQEQLGFGICLADDMGLGKTVQLLALLAWEREVSLPVGSQPAVDAAVEPVATQPAPAPAPLDVAVIEPAPGAPVDGAQVDGAGTTPVGAPAGSSPYPDSIHDHNIPPTLLLVPMSVVGNWMHETKRFCPHLRLLVHHGAERAVGDAFIEKANRSDLIVTTYALANRDKETLQRVKWGRIVLDEAQYIKNPSAKQSQAVRSFDAIQRVALTGTPVENRLTELWSIMDFLNPGYLGSSNGFRTKFALPIERYRDKARSEQLRGLIRPFVLRRLKSDPTVVADLPEKVETKEYGHLTTEQAALYEGCVKRMLNEVDEVDGMQRRGLVLATLIKLKQICNHPLLVLKGAEDLSTVIADPTRAGKCIRILEMLDEVIAEGDQALVFTQFREMGKLLVSMIANRFGKDVLFIHGGTTQPQRQALIERFQKADGTAPVLVLSLRAGGVGLNLTAATHVFHFDRWWNPAVENQATDRAYRIGQTRTVQVHKFVVRGTLEERIDQMIESKTELAENIIGSGEAWLSEMSTDQLRDILTLRNEAVDDEA